MRYALLAVLFVIWAGAAAQASLKYYPDPVYQKLNDEDHLPMADIIDMAENGDVRAQFIMGDLYAKGKGGMPKDLTQAKRWFEEAAIHGYDHSFIRLAAMAKRDNKPVEAWQWYSLGIRAMDSGDKRSYVLQARHELVDSAQLSQADIKQARQAMDDWEDMRDKRLYEEKKAAQERINKENEAGEKKNEQN